MLRTPPSPVVSAATSPRRGRIAGIDIARGLALIGMFTVHVVVADPEGEPLSGWAEWWLTAPSGRASVLFMLLAGVSLSIVSERGVASGSSVAIRRRGVVLLVGGLLLSASVWGASILEHYGFLFLIAPWILARSNRAVAAIAAAGMFLGPLALYGAGEQLTFDPPGDGVIDYLWRTITGLLFFGTYPLVVWFGIFAVGILVGRLDLGSNAVAGRIAAAGLTLIAGLAVVIWTFGQFGIESASYEFDDTEFDDTTFDDSAFDESKLGAGLAPGTKNVDPTTLSACWSLPKDDWRTPGTCVDEKVFGEDFWGDDGEFGEEFDGFGGDDELRDLLGTEPHSGTTGWAVQSIGIALAILGFALLLPSIAQRALRPLAMLGSISLTAYLVHIFLVSDVWGSWVEDQRRSVVGRSSRSWSGCKHYSSLSPS